MKRSSDKSILSRLSLSVKLLASSLAVMALSGCSLNELLFEGRMSTWDPKGPIAEMQLEVFWATIWVTVILFFLVAGSLFYAVWKFRETPENKDEPMAPVGHGNPLIEIGLIAGSILMLVFIAVPTVKGIWYQHSLPEGNEEYEARYGDYENNLLANWYDGDIVEGEEDEVLTVKAYGWQWWWSFEYPQLDGVVTANELVIPKGKVVKIELRSKDVIHSFWLPKIAGKVDLMPGRVNWMWIQADEEGYYYGQCAEYCGDSHAYMLFRAEVVEPDAFADWIDHQKREIPAPEGFDSWGAWNGEAFNNPEIATTEFLKGALAYMQKGNCAMCHNINGVSAGKIAPDLTNVKDRKSLAAGWMENVTEDGEVDKQAQYDNLVEWIFHSEKVKPGNLMYYPASGLKNIIHPEDENGNPLPPRLTEEDVKHIATFLQQI
ncbi:MAG: cytochrome c oxidase subunit II [Opitutales bacterium]